MTIRDLIKELTKYPDDTTVCFTVYHPDDSYCPDDYDYYEVMKVWEDESPSGRAIIAIGE